MEPLRITAGMGDISSYIPLVEAGADEIFCGYVPYEWNRRCGSVLPLNRREVLFSHVQVGTREDMALLRRLVDRYGVPVTVTFNSLTYAPELLPDIAAIIRELADLGFQDLIIADVNLIRYLSAHRVPCRIHVSGEIGEWSTYTLRLLQNFSNDTTRISRIIFHRKCTFEDMRRLIEAGQQLDPRLEFEAFCMNENCHYTGGTCSSLHCDELVHLCRLEYRRVQKGADPLCDQLQLAATLGTDTNCTPNCTRGSSGCGLCAIPALRRIGVTHLKVVGRGLPPEDVAKDIAAVRAVIDAGEARPGKPANCSGNCYYPEV